MVDGLLAEEVDHVPAGVREKGGLFVPGADVFPDLEEVVEDGQQLPQDAVFVHHENVVAVGGEVGVEVDLADVFGGGDDAKVGAFGEIPGAVIAVVVDLVAEFRKQQALRGEVVVVGADEDLLVYAVAVDTGVGGDVVGVQLIGQDAVGGFLEVKKVQGGFILQEGSINEAGHGFHGLNDLVDCAVDVGLEVFVEEVQAVLDGGIKIYGADVRDAVLLVFAPFGDEAVGRVVMVGGLEKG